MTRPICAYPKVPRYIETVRGVGYRLAEAV